MSDFKTLFQMSPEEVAKQQEAVRLAAEERAKAAELAAQQAADEQLFDRYRPTIDDWTPAVVDMLRDYCDMRLQGKSPQITGPQFLKYRNRMQGPSHHGFGHEQTFTVVEGRWSIDSRPYMPVEFGIAMGNAYAGQVMRFRVNAYSSDPVFVSTFEEAVAVLAALRPITPKEWDRLQYGKAKSG